MAEDNKIRLTKEGQQDRMVTQSQAQPFLDQGFTQSADQTPIQTPTAPLGQEAAFEFAQRLPQPSPTITPENLGTSQPITLPESQLPDATSGDALLTSATTNIDQIMKALTPEVTPEQEKDQSIRDLMADLTGELGQKGAEQLSLEQQSQLPQLRQQFAELNSKILEKNAEFETLKQSYEQANLMEESRPQTLSSLQGAQSRNYRMFLAQKNALASEAGFLQAQAQGLQGRITDAQNTVNRAIDLKYSTIESQLNTYQAQLNAIQPELNRQEQKRATAQQIFLNNQLRELEDKKESEKQIQSVMLEAISNGINDTEVLAQISNATDYGQALRVLGANMPEPEVDTQIIQAGGRQLLIDTQTGQTIQDLGATEGALSRAQRTKETQAPVTPVVPTSVVDVTPIPTIEEFREQLENERLQPLPEEVVQAEYQKLLQQQEDAREQVAQNDPRLAGLSPSAVQAALNPVILRDKTPTRRDELQTELFNAGFTAEELQSGATKSLRNEFTKGSNEFVKIRDSFTRVKASSQGGPAGDLALIFNYMKMLDPGSVVRESEFATAQNAGSVPERIRAQYNRVLSGEFLSESQREDFVGQAENLYNAAVANQTVLEDEFKRLADEENINKEAVIIDFKNVPKIDADISNESIDEFLSNI